MEDSPAIMDSLVMDDSTTYINTSPNGLNMNGNSNIPQIVILRQNSLAIEKFSKNGIQRGVHVVVKNQPFLIQVGIYNNNNLLDFTKAPLEARLLYDSDNLKEVDFVKLKPLEYKCHTNDRGDQVTVEVRLKVLSSQLEDMFFRIKLIALDPNTKQRIESIAVISEPIKVVSKPDSIRKKKGAPSAPATPALNTPSNNTNTNNNNNNNNTNSKKTSDHSDFVNQLLHKIETTCEIQQQLLSQLYNQVEFNKTTQINPPSMTIDPNLMAMQYDQQSMYQHSAKKQFTDKKKEQTPPTDFEKAFVTFLRTFDKIHQTDEVPERIRRAVRNRTRETESLCELLESVSMEAQLQHEEELKLSGNGSNNNNNNSIICQCFNCPYKRELERIDEFYNEFLFTGPPATSSSCNNPNNNDNNVLANFAQ